MSLFATLVLAVRALLRNRSRSLLTMLGVIIGVAAVIVTIAIGTGARASVSAQINGLGSNLVMVIPGSVSTTGARTGSGGASTLTVDDGLAVAKLPGAAAVSPLVNVRTQVIAQQNNWQTSATGAAPSFPFIRQWPMASGTFFTQADVTDVAKVCVLGQTVVAQLFPDGGDPVGKTVSIGAVPFTVIGTLAARGQSAGGQDQDDTVIIPYTSAMERLTGAHNVNSLMVSASDASQIAPLQTQIVALLEQRHRIVPPRADDFQVRNLQDIAAAASSTAATMQYLLAGVAAVSLLVGGIGIMNIMLVSVTERTREIGLRIAVGARSVAIMRQFLIEAVVLATTGGAIGVAIGEIGSLLVSLVGHWPATVPASSIALSVAFSAAVGVFFGYYPARKAARLNPIEALRFE